MDRFEAIRTLIAAVDGGSLSAASRALNVPLPTVSRRVADLEAHLGAQLLVRTSRKLLLTEAGAAYLASVRRVMEELAEAERAASGEYRVPRGELLITAPILFGKLHVAPIVHDFLTAFPQVTVRLVLSDAVVDIVGNRIDVAVRIGALPDSALLAKRVGEIASVTCASPDYLARRGAPATPADLARHDTIAFEGLELDRDWPYAGRITERIRPRYSVDTAESVIAGALAGIGIANVFSYQAADSVQAGTLRTVLADFAPPPLPVHIVHPPREPMPLKMRAFLDFAAPRLTARLKDVAAIYRG